MTGTQFFETWRRLTEAQRQRIRNKARWEHETLMAALARFPEHCPHADGPGCWCQPRLSYEDPVTETQVWVHKEAVS